MQHYAAREIIRQRTSEMRAQASRQRAAQQARRARQADEARPTREGAGQARDAGPGREPGRSGAAGRDQAAVPEPVPAQRVADDADDAYCGAGPRARAC
jgi:hypothetical protein